MVYTIADGLADIRHELGGDLVGIDPLRVLNEAGQKLYGVRPWNFLVRVGTELESVVDQSWIELPADFGRIVTLDYTDQITSGVIQTTLAHINLYRAQAPAIPSYALFVSVSWVIDVSPAVPVPRLEVYPTPSTSTADLLTMTYRVRWVPLTGTDTTPIQIPDWFEGLYRQAVRATASGYQRGDMEERFGALMGGWDFEAAVRQDTDQQTDYGSLMFGAMDMGSIAENVEWSLRRQPLPPAPG